ncbi:hypothetical protein [Actinoplanes sp. DH11]|uniref:hypothetical protein n=1 Tax=Actinoplanes sp. DH11 TaxID=2857011 RepID=UPI001E2B6F56|nr:hypothetical protein [Actinoplanes sp. DH11]
MPEIPDDLWNDLDPALPVALLPVRIETRFGYRSLDGPGAVTDARRMPVLRVRIYPDEISVVPGDIGLRPAEIAAGQDFWRDHAAADSAEPAAGRQHRRHAAWEVLTRRVGVGRALHVARATRTGQALPAAPARATARLLPDSWIVLGYAGEQLALSAHITRADTTVPVGPEPDKKLAFVPAEPWLLADAELRWTVDFDAACARGLATCVDLGTVDPDGTVRPPTSTHLDRLVVLGIRAPSAGHDPLTETARLTELFEDQDALGRIGFLPAGTPTNNHDGARSGWTRTGDVFAGYRRLFQQPAAPPAEGALRGVPAATAAAALSTALGLEHALLSGLENGGDPGPAHAAAMSRALFPAAFAQAPALLIRRSTADGTEARWAPHRDDTEIRFLGHHAGDYVRARGPLPTLRIGRQPYGVLPVLPLAAWMPEPGEDSLTTLVDVLRRLRPFWVQVAGRRFDTVDRILGQGPVPDPGHYKVSRITGDPASVTAVDGLTATIIEVPAAGGRSTVEVRLDDSLAGHTHVALQKIFDRVERTHLPSWEQSPADDLNLLIAGNPAEYLTGLADGRPTEPPPPQLLYYLVRSSLAETAPPRVPPFRPPAPETVIIRADSVLRRHLDDLQIAEHPLRDATVAGVRVLAEEGRAGRISAAVYTQLVGEVLATAANRLDAWLTSIATRRLDRMRTARPEGLHLGYWGVVVDLRLPTGPDGRPTEPGPPESAPAPWQPTLSDRTVVRPTRTVRPCHAPSLAQARTAAVLRAAELNHRGARQGDPVETGTLASLDLTSRRARTARYVLQAVANGQPLGAVLGSMLERRLGDAGLHEWVAVLRKEFPQHQPAPEPEQPAPPDVLDGLAAWRAWTARPGAIRQLRADDTGLSGILNEHDVTVQAISDTVVAEGLHQLVSGRHDRAGDIFTAQAQGLPLPADVEVLRTPASGTMVTHRLLLTLDTTPDTPPEASRNVRAGLAPGVEAWAGGILGDLGRVRVRVSGHDAGGHPVDARHSVADLGIGALDVVVESGGPYVLTERFGQLAAVARDLRVFDTGDGSWTRLLAMAAAAAVVLAAARPAGPADLARPPQRDDPAATAPAPLPAAALHPIADHLATVLAALSAGVAAVAAACAPEMTDDRAVPHTLFQPFAEAGLTGAFPVAGTATAGPARGCAAAASGMLADVSRIVATADPEAATGDWTQRLRRCCAAPAGAQALTDAVRRVGGDAVVAVAATPAGLGTYRVPEAQLTGGGAHALLERFAVVRDRIAAYDDLRLFVEAGGGTPEPLTAVQLPWRDGDRWVGGPLPPANRGTDPCVHLVVAGAPALVDRSTVSALVLDEVTETLPTFAMKPGKDAMDTEVAATDTGVALHYDGPDARPPQSVLLAVCPNLAEGWSWQTLQATIAETVELARLRTVELEDLAKSEIGALLPLTNLRDGLPRMAGINLSDSVVARNRDWLAQLGIKVREPR